MAEVQEQPTLIQYNLGHRWSFVPNALEEHETRRVPRPSHEELCAMVYHFMVDSALQHYRIMNCYGCQYDRPSQVDHMGGIGCLMDSVDAIEYFIDEGVAKVTSEHLKRAYLAVLHRLRIDCDYAHDLFEKTISDNLPGLVCEVLVKQVQEGTDEYHTAFANILGSCKDLFGGPLPGWC